MSEGRTVAASYALESAGGDAGGLLSSLGLHWGVQNFALALTGSLIAAAAPLLIATGAQKNRSRPAAIIFCGIPLPCLYLAPTLDGMMTRWNHPSLLESRDTPYGRVSSTQRESQVSVFVNNALVDIFSSSLGGPVTLSDDGAGTTPGARCAGVVRTDTLDTLGADCATPGP